jgi:hypothetical protein
MPQLDLLIFKYETFNFLFSFFLFFFINQYFVFPRVVKNIFLRRKLITRSLYNSNEVYFFLSLIKNYKPNVIDSLTFVIKFSEVRSYIISFIDIIFKIFSLFFFVKKDYFFELICLFKSKVMLIIFSNSYLYEKQSVM